MEVRNQLANYSNDVKVTQEGVFINLQIKIVYMMLKFNLSLIEQRLNTKLKLVGIIIIMMLIVVGIILIVVEKDMIIWGKLEILIK